jgi:hemerythrin-like domain-containing protein
MNANEIGAALNTVEQDHRFVLEKMQMLKNIVEFMCDSGNPDPQLIIERLDNINKFFVTEFEAHMEEEEVTLFPLLEKHISSGPDLVARLKQEHEDLRRLREEFGNCLTVAGQLDGALPPMVFKDLLSFGWEFWDLLDNHAHSETRALQQCLVEKGKSTGSSFSREDRQPSAARGHAPKQ